MKTCKRLICAALISALMLAALSGCFSDPLDEVIPSTAPGQSSVIQPTTPPSVPVTPPTLPPAETVTQPTQPEDPTPTFSTLTDLRDYMNATVDSGTLEFSFRYTGTDKPSGQRLAQILSCCFINYNWTGDLCDVTVTEYPGERMADAFLSGDSSMLSQTESQVLDDALGMVINWTSIASDPWELELLIHDYLSENVLYLTGDVNFTDPTNIPRELTAIGALQDGRANCQGYVDAFYLLGTLAGLTVDRMYVEDASGYHVVNTIYLDGQWYIVDVTYDDMDDDSILHHYLFNVGTDRVREYVWEPELEYRPIAKETGPLFYYAYQGTQFYDEQSAANYIAQNWDGDVACFRFMIFNQTVHQPMDDALYSTLMDLGLPFSYTYWCYTDGTDAYFALFFQ